MRLKKMISIYDYLVKNVFKVPIILNYEPESRQAEILYGVMQLLK
ncbi:hypothetical protein [Scytonema sp. UIC 10036]|nr:hypothetical protein [Scytonema sp. UIC 10036]